MILKIRTQIKDKNNDESWYLIDGIESLSYKYMSKDKAREATIKYNKDYDIRRFSSYTHKDATVCEVILNLKTRVKAKIIYLDDKTFILNDEGKTVDKIYG